MTAVDTDCHVCEFNLAMTVEEKRRHLNRRHTVQIHRPDADGMVPFNNTLMPLDAVHLALHPHAIEAGHTDGEDHGP